jgi:GNAT superfamily N-acetyltransferase
MSLGFVRPARESDAPEIARIQLSTWRTAYRTLLPRTILNSLDEAEMAEAWRAAITAPPSDRHRVLIAIEQAGPTAGSEDYVAGFAAAGPADDDALAPEEKPLPDDVVAFTDLLVEPRWGRRGHGSRLLAACVDIWRTDGFLTAVAWAYEKDPATRGFLTSAGWEADGVTRALDVDDLLIPQLRLHTTLT